MFIRISFCALIAFIAGCSSSELPTIPSQPSLVAAASANGRFNVTIEKYDPDLMIAIVQTPGSKPQRKPYQFDGKKWVPLWSPYESPQLKRAE